MIISKDLPTEFDDPFFGIPDNHKWNALIGCQGSEENYVDGYIQAAIELASVVIDKRMLEKRDTLVLPILYNARHAIELSLKFTINKLYEIDFTKSHQSNHDIMSHWNLLNCSTIGDEEMRTQIGNLRPFVISLSNIDQDGQALRYFMSKSGQSNLSNYSLENIEVILRSLNRLHIILSRLRYRVICLLNEHRTGSFTKECSRSDLIEIAQTLPLKNDWQTSDFSEAKSLVMKRFNLTSRGFTRALNIIKINREMNTLIGIENNLLHITDSNILYLAKKWSEFCPPCKDGGRVRVININQIDADDLILEDLRFNEMTNSIACKLTPLEIADLETIFYLGRDGTFCEYYEACFERTLNEHQRDGDQIKALGRVLEKTSFLGCLANGINKLGRPSLSRQIIEMRPDLISAILPPGAR